MTEAPERIWIEDEFGDGDEDQWTYGTWDVRNYRGYVVEYVRADTVQALTAERDRLREALEQIEITCEEEIRARTAWMSEAAIGKSRILPLLQIPRNIARTALKGESHE